MLCLSALALDWLLFINILVENIAGWEFALTFAIIQKSYLAVFMVYILINIVLVALAGSGIPEIKGCLNGVGIHGVLLFITLIGKRTGEEGEEEACLRENNWKVLLAITVPDSSDLSVRRFVFQTSTCYVQ